MTNFVFPRHARILGFDAVEKAFREVTEAITSQEKYPPYDIEKVQETGYIIRAAVAGFEQDEISVTRTEDNLIVTGRHKSNESSVSFIHRGIAKRDFQLQFKLTNGVTVSEVTLNHGILEIHLESPTPKQDTTVYEINAKKPARQDLFE